MAKSTAFLTLQGVKTRLAIKRLPVLDGYRRTRSRVRSCESRRQYARLGAVERIPRPPANRVEKSLIWPNLL